MHASRQIMLSLAFLAPLFMLSTVLAQNSADQKAAQEKEQQLIAVLQSDAPAAEKAITCKRLAVFGGPKSIPALAPLLSDAQLASWARIAIEAIPGPEADEALRSAVAKLHGRLLVGTIHSMGVRRDADAVDVLTELLQDQDARVATAAALALGRVGTADATKVLRRFLDEAPIPVRPAVAEGSILCAEHLMAAGQANQAAEIYDQVRQTQLPTQRLLEATRGAILARGTKGIPLLVEQLRSDDSGFFQIGLSTARELPGREATAAIAAELVRTTPDHGVLLLGVLADRGDATALPTVLQAAQSGHQTVRIAAIGVVQRLGDTSCLPTLLEIALESDQEISQAAKTALANLPGKEVDDELAIRLQKADETTLPLLVELVGLRQIPATEPLIRAVDHSNAVVRRAALLALGATAGPDQLAILISRVIDLRHDEDIPVARQALRTAAIRMPDREAVAKQLVTAMSSVSVATQCSLLEILASMGGTTSLHAMGTAAKTSEVELQDTATRLLGEWMNVDAGPLLLELAKASDNRYQVRALRGYIRLVRQFPMSDQQRVVMCRQALENAGRTAEKKLVLDVMARYPSIEMLQLAVQGVHDSAIKNDATAVAMGIAKKLGIKAVDVRQLLTQIEQEPVEVEIIKAEYGVGSTQKDVTEIVRRHVGNTPWIALPNARFNSAFGGDPAPGTVKQLKIEYRINGKTAKASFAEDAAIVLPVPK